MTERRPRSKVTSSGDATAIRGYANTGVHIGEVNLTTGAPVRSRYHQQVQRIAPQELVGRQDELEVLAEFCTSPATRGCYQWWRADAWSGKSALLSWFVLHPPAGVRVASFFVTARLSGQNDRVAFIENTLEQLLAFVGEDAPPILTDSTREAHLLGLIAEAAELCKRRNEEFVLVVDGLDEDRGVHAGLDAYSIASLLPISLPAGMRVIVSGRPNPPIPSDVPSRHPLYRQDIVKRLLPSPKAEAVRQEMERDLKRLMLGSELQEDLLGFIAAAQAGLTIGDLAALIGCSEWDVGDHLRSSAGRSFVRRESHYSPRVAPDVFILGHEELQVTANEMMGERRLAGYRERLNAWADQYDSLGWPQNTPEYLLRGYVNMLAGSNDMSRLVRIGVSAARQDRIYRQTGSDNYSLTEIGESIDIIASQQDPSLTDLVRLAIHRDHLKERNSRVPVDTNKVWALLGQVSKAEYSAAYVKSPAYRVQAAAARALAEFKNGEKIRALEILTHANELADTIVDSTEQGWALGAVAEAAGTIDLSRSIKFVAAIKREAWRAKSLASVAQSAVAAGSVELAEQLFVEVEALARVSRHADERVLALVALADLAADLGKTEIAIGIALEAESIAGTITSFGERSRGFVLVAEALHALGQRDRGLTLLRQGEAAARLISAPIERSSMLRLVAQSFAACGEVEDAVIVANSIDAPAWRAKSFAAIASCGTVFNQFDRLSDLLERGEVAARSVDNAAWKAWALVGVAEYAAKVGDIDRATRLVIESGTVAHSSSDVVGKAETLIYLATELALQGSVALSEDIASAVLGSVDHARALASVAAALSAHGRHDRVHALLDRAEAVARDSESLNDQTKAISAVSAQAAKAGDFARAAQLAQSISDPSERISALVVVVRNVARSGSASEAVAIAMATESPAVRLELLAQIAIVDSSSEVLSLMEKQAKKIKGVQPELVRGVRAAVDVLIRVGHLDHAEQLANLPSLSSVKMQVVLEIIERAAALDDISRAERLASTVTDPGERLAAYISMLPAVKRSCNEGELRDLLARAEEMVDKLSYDAVRVLALIDLAEAVGQPGIRLDHSSVLILQARDHLDMVRNEEERSVVRESLALAAARIGCYDLADQMVQGMTNPNRKASILAAMAEIISKSGRLDRAEAVARSFTNFPDRAFALRSVAVAAAEGGELRRAERLANMIPSYSHRISTLMLIVGHFDPAGRGRIISSVIRIGGWQEALPVVVQKELEALALVAREIISAARRK